MIAAFIKLGAILDFSVQIFIFLGNKVFHNATLFTYCLISILWASVVTHIRKHRSLKRASVTRGFLNFLLWHVRRGVTCPSVAVWSRGIWFSFRQLLCLQKKALLLPCPFCLILFFVSDGKSTTHKLTSTNGQTWVWERTKVHNADVKAV